MLCDNCLHNGICPAASQSDTDDFTEKYGCEDFMDSAEWAHISKRENINILSKRFRKGSH